MRRKNSKFKKKKKGKKGKLFSSNVDIHKARGIRRVILIPRA